MLLVNSEVDLIRCFHSWCLNKGPVGCQDTNEVIPMPYMGMGQNFVLTHEHQNSWWNGCSFRIWFAGQVLPNPHVQPGWYPQFLPGRHHEVCPQHLDHQQTLPEPHLDRLGPLKKKNPAQGQISWRFGVPPLKNKAIPHDAPRAKMTFLVMILLPNFHCIPWMLFSRTGKNGLACTLHNSLLPFSASRLPQWSCQNGRPKKMDGRPNLAIHWNIVNCLFRT